ncbi:MAG: hypothetical protein K6A32_04530 [Bacteroidales bacterium]|nr:hypothetical protein [Bacteroidales bacterium]
MVDSLFSAHNGPSVEEVIRQWWRSRFEGPLPEDVKQWLRETIRNEVARQRSTEHRLDDVSLQKVRDGRRLCQTKLDNLESSISLVRQQLDRLHRFVEIHAELTEQKARLYQINKRQASLLNDQRELERYEEFEPVSGRFQRLAILQRNIADGRQLIAQLALRQDEANRLTAEAEKTLVLEQNKTEEALQAVQQAARTMSDVQQLQVQIDDALNADAANAAELQEQRKRLGMIEKERQENLQEVERLRGEMSSLKQQEQILEIHKAMIHQGGAIQVKLDRLFEVRELCERLTEELNQAQHRQKERDEQLERLFREKLAIDDVIRGRKEEMTAHRQSIAGKDSFTLQRRALELRSRKLMLTTGLSLWHSIAAGYDMIENKEQVITQLRLHIDHLNYRMDALSKDVSQLSRQQQQKNYHWTLSKSQNVVQLRGDLSEGNPCSVCGATHHPWQSEGAAGQNALISSLKADCEAVEVELANKRRELETLNNDLIATQTRLEVENISLDHLRERQRKDTDEWQHFAHLDRSLVDCTPATNREARAMLIQQLIEKTTVDAEEAEKELNAFTFNLDSISDIGNEIQLQQQKLADLSEHLNEVNTACQVMAGTVEKLALRLKNATDTYSRRYEALEKLVTIPEWFKKWRNSHEAVKQTIQQMMDQWEGLKADIERHECQLAMAETKKELLDRAVMIIKSDIMRCEAVASKTKERLGKAESNLSKLLPGGDGVGLFNENINRLNSQKVLLEKSRENYLKFLREQMALQEKQVSTEESIHLIERHQAVEQREIDLWMQRYNANNPPVQMAELERLLADGRDWNDIRKRVREVVQEQSVVQARVDRLHSLIISLQADGLRPVADDGSNEEELLQGKIDDLEQKRRAVLQQMAHFDEQLKLHQQTARPNL